MATPSQSHPLTEASLSGIPLPSTLRPQFPINDADLLEFSSRNPLYRIERNAKGELEIMTPVGGDGSRWEAYVIRELSIWAEEHGGVSFSSNAGFSLPDGSVLSPDAAWVSQSRWDALTDTQRSSFPPLCPELVVEILSASDSRAVLCAKMDVWVSNGALIAWLIDPRAGEILIYRSGKEPETLSVPDFVEADGPAAGFRLQTSRFWKR